MLVGTSAHIITARAAYSYGRQLVSLGRVVVLFAVGRPDVTFCVFCCVVSGYIIVLDAQPCPS